MKRWRWFRPNVEEEVEGEIAFHLEMRTRELIAAGWSPEQARAESRRRLGDLEAMTQRLTRLGRQRDRTMSRTLWIHEFARDVRYAFRALARSPGFGLTALATLAV